MPRRQLRFNHENIIERRRHDVWQMAECRDKMREVMQMLERMARRSPEIYRTDALLRASRELEQKFANEWEALRDDPYIPDDHIEP